MPIVLEGIAAEVDVTRVKSLILGRAPNLLDVDDPRHDLYLAAVEGIATEVVAIVGTDPQAPVRNLAVWAVTVGVAAYLELGLFPEQQLGGGDNTGEVLQRRYLGVLAQLRNMPGVGTAGSLPITAPLGDFPEPFPFPGLDPYPSGSY